ncbi:hypothetical protein [Nonlabens sp.]|uniref:hypothetical protein n=1 Tax=Nonlabens sp. TaxID=1888209 RepID=UPI001BCB2BF5|nr:hypothetical protein [Nonlabens sp.]
MFTISILICCFGFSQNNNFETAISFKVGAIGGWIAAEVPLSDKIILNAEFGQEGGFYKNRTDNDTQFFFTNTLSLEPRYFFNREKRKEAGKSINLNSGSYFGIEFMRVPDWLTISSDNSDIRIEQSFSIIPKIGLKRAIANIMTFEFAGGIGYQFNDNLENSLTVGLDLRIGILLYYNRYKK